MVMVYVLYSRKLDRLYIGQTEDLKKRLGEHRRGESFWTRRAQDWQLVYQEELVTRRRTLLTITTHQQKAKHWHKICYEMVCVAIYPKFPLELF